MISELTGLVESSLGKSAQMDGEIAQSFQSSGHEGVGILV